MPEGPSIVILKEEVQAFKGKKVIEASGNSKVIDMELLKGQVILDFKSFGKQFLMCFRTFTISTHLMLFGSYRVNEEKDAVPRLSMKFKNGVLNFYSCSVKIIEGDLNDVYDWTGDVMSDTWDPQKALIKLQASPDMLVCDALLDQNIFAGVGNIIKNEVLYRIKVSPMSTLGAMPLKQLKLLVKEASNYSFQFYEWKRLFELKKHWQVYNKKICPRDNVSLSMAYLGKFRRRTFYCTVCQKLYE